MVTSHGVSANDSIPVEADYKAVENESLVPCLELNPAFITLGDRL